MNLESTSDELKAFGMEPGLFSFNNLLINLLCQNML